MGMPELASAQRESPRAGSMPAALTAVGANPIKGYTDHDEYSNAAVAASCTASRRRSPFRVNRYANRGFQDVLDFPELGQRTRGAT
jgi:hypothetical protein